MKKEYLLKFKLEGDRRIRVHEVDDVREAQAIVKAALPAVFTRIPMVETRSGRIVAILPVK
jgi:hypothetical protein